MDWSLKNTGLAIRMHFVMEATGIYHEQLATFLYDKGVAVFGRQPGASQVLRPKPGRTGQERQKGQRGAGALRLA